MRQSTHCSLSLSILTLCLCTRRNPEWRYFTNSLVKAHASEHSTLLQNLTERQSSQKKNQIELYFDNLNVLPVRDILRRVSTPKTELAFPTVCYMWHTRLEAT
jgi:hypothetical protein